MSNLQQFDGQDSSHWSSDFYQRTSKTELK